MIKHVFCFACLLTAISSPAVTINCNSGALADLLENPATQTELTITGTVNAADLDFIDKQCTSIRSLDLSNATIASYSGARLRGLTQHPENMIPAQIFSGSPITSITLPTSANLVIGDAAFAGSAITTITLNNNISQMGVAAFSGCPYLTEVTISTPALGEGAFAGCEALETVKFTTSVALPDNAFSSCSSLSSVQGSENITTIGSRAFANCSALQSLDFGKNLTSIDSQAFAVSGLVEVDLTPCKALTGIGDWAFANMPDLKTLKMGSASTVGAGVVFNCPKLVDLEYAENAEAVSDYAFVGCNAVDTTGLFNDNIVSIGRYALSGLNQITTITLPSTLEFIDDHAMENMAGLAAITISVGAPELGEDVWYGINQKAVMLYVPETVANSYKEAEQWREFNIALLSSSVGAIGDDVLAGLRARFQGDELVVSIKDVDIKSLALYDPAGVMIARLAPNSDYVVIDTAGSASRVFIVVANLADGRTASLKIAK